MGADFKNQKKLVEINYNEKLNFLKEEERIRSEKIAKLKETINFLNEIRQNENK